MKGIYSDDSLEKFDGVPKTLSSFASPRERNKLVRQEAGGAKPSFGGSGQVIQRPKIVKLVSAVEVFYRDELKLVFIDSAGKALAQSDILTPRRWRCVSGRLERKFQMASGVGDVIRTDEIEQVLMAAPGGDLTLIETITVVGDAKAAPKRTEAHFSRVKK